MNKNPQQPLLPQVVESAILNRMIKNAKWCRRMAHDFRRVGNSEQFHVWMNLAHKSVGSCRRLVNSGALV